MTITEILKGESVNTEFKEKRPTDSKKFMKTVVAFANCNGGRIIFGIKDDTLEIVGIPKDMVFSEIDAITNIIADSCKPAIIPNITVQTVSEKTLIVVEIIAGMQRPYYLKSEGMEKGTYIRVAGTSRPAEDYQIREMISESSPTGFDKSVCPNKIVTVEEAQELCKQMREIAISNCHDNIQKSNVKELTINNLLSWGILQKQKDLLIASNAYALLTGDSVIPTKIQCAIFKGNTRAIFVDRREFSGSILNELEEAYKYILAKINLGARINGLVREDVYEFPINTIRELLTNAVLHRSYLDSSNIQIALYDNRLEITSPGGLMRGLTINHIKEGYSKTRNEALASAFLYMNLIENWGSGIPRAIEDMKEYGLPEPEFLNLDIGFRINLYRQSHTNVNSIVSDSKVPKAHGDTLDDTLERKISELIIQNPSVTQNEISETLSISVATVKRTIKKMTENGIIERTGGRRYGEWIIKK